MGVTVTYVHAHPQTGRLFYRRAFAPAIRPYVSTGRLEVKRSLGASTLTRGARARYEAAEAEYERLVAQAERKASGTFDDLTEPVIVFMADQYKMTELVCDERARKGLAAPVRPYETRKALEDDYIESRAMLFGRFSEHPSDMDQAPGFDRQGIIGYWADWVTSYADAEGYAFDPASEKFGDLCEKIAISAIEVWLEVERRSEGSGSPTPPMPLSLAKVEAFTPPASSKTSFGETAALILDSSRHAVGAATKEGARTALRFFKEACGPLTPTKITRATVATWVDLMAERPARLSVAERSLSLQVLSDRYKGRDDVQRMSKNTLSHHVSAMSALWSKAQEDGAIDKDHSNPFRAMRSLRSARKKMPQLTTAELNAIFRLPVFTEGARPVRGKGEAAYWLPLLLLWTGARPGEVAQLMVSDVFRERDDPEGRWTLQITDEGVHPFGGERKLKTGSTGARAFPVPQALLELNFIDYAQSLVAAGETALFPLLRPKGARKDLFEYWGEWWRSYVYDNDVYASGQDRRPGREFRHAWTTAARASGIPRDARMYLQGHHTDLKDPSTNDAYGLQGPLGKHIDSLSFEGLDLSGVRPWQASGNGATVGPL
jgi:integrase